MQFNSQTPYAELERPDRTETRSLLAGPLVERCPEAAHRVRHDLWKLKSFTNFPYNVQLSGERDKTNQYGLSKLV